MRQVINYKDKKAKSLLAAAIQEALTYNTEKLPIAIVCIGTDRLTGDCLGPLIGTELNKKRNLKHIKVIGCFDELCHAKNLDQLKTTGYFVIAIDACIDASIGNIILEKGALRPGSGFQKNLAPVGDICIKGVVCSTAAVLQYTRLGFVSNMGTIIVSALQKALA